MSVVAPGNSLNQISASLNQLRLIKSGLDDISGLAKTIEASENPNVILDKLVADAQRKLDRQTELLQALEKLNR